MTSRLKSSPNLNLTLNSIDDSPVRQRQQGRDAAQLARRAVAERARRGAASACDAGAPGITVHPRADGGTSRPTTSATIAAALAGAAARGRVQHRRRSAARAARRWSTRCGRISARWCRSCRARSRARRAGSRARAPSGCRRSFASFKAHGIRVSLFVDAEPEPIRLGGIGRRRPRRALHRAVRAGVRAGSGRRRAGRSRSTRTRRSWRTRSAWASTPATISTSTTSCCSATLPHLDEVSIGHALISRALFVGLDRVVREYLRGARRPVHRSPVTPEL